MKKILTVLAVLALAGSGILAADKILKGDQLVVAGVNFPQPFKTPSGQILKAGVYDLKVISEGGDGVLIGLLQGGKQVGQLRGIVKALPVDQGVRKQPAGGPGMALPVDQGIKLQPTTRGGKAFQDLGFTPASPVSFLGGTGKISCSNNLQPGGANLPYIEFAFVPAIQKTK